MSEQPGYEDTPIIPGTSWRVHDSNRPQAPVVNPGSHDDQEAPSDATVLFSGHHLSAWEGRDGEARWTVEDGYMEVNGTGSIRTREEFGDCQLHLEWATPEQVVGSSQGRGNSGVFLMGTYEIQVLDSFENPTYADGQAGAIYGQFPPFVNASRKPGEWQSYDILFRAPTFAEDQLQAPAYLTVFHNGILIHDRQALKGPTHHRVSLKYEPQPAAGPLELQDHGNPVRYRNIWIRRI